MASHRDNQIGMATRLADWIEANVDIDPAVRLAAYERATEDEWARTAEYAGEGRGYVPSESTRACVLIALRERLRPLDAGLLDGIGARG